MSVQSTSIAPKFWIEFKRFTIVLRLDIATAPFARFVVTIIGSISGVSPTAMARPNRKASSQFPLLTPLISTTTGTITAMNLMNSQLTLFTPMSNAVVARRPTRPLAMAPNDVRLPVAMTAAIAVPLMTLVPMKQIVGMSVRPVDNPAATGGAARSAFSTGSASPVSADWATNRSLAASSRTSAGIMSPAERYTMSPGTNSSMGSSRRRITGPGENSSPARSTVALVLTSLRNASADCVDRNS